jgi:peptidoglycan/LPS O-acetylase OafA/YrhL
LSIFVKAWLSISKTEIKPQNVVHNLKKMTKEKTIYLTGLNGIRAIAAFGVMISHINLQLQTFSIKSFSLFGFNELKKPRGWNLGEQGVTMFFVLSGFLITYLLLLEKQKTNYIDIKKFYIRRILRIWPLYYFYLALSTLSYFLFTSNTPELTIFSLYIFLLANIPFILSKALSLCDHLWSIAVEEQFYLFWPHLFKKINKSENFLIFIIAFSIIIRIFLWYFFPFKFFTVLFTVNRFDCMLFGGLIALLMFKDNKIISILNHKISQLFAWFAILLHILNFEFINSIISMELITLCTGIIIIGQIKIKNRTINLENNTLNFLGKYSYGIYIYHPLFIFLFSKSLVFNNIENEIIKSILVFTSIILTTIIVAYLSYELFEKKFINLKSKYSVIHSSNNNK